jgi:hypothetical protein
MKTLYFKKISLFLAALFVGALLLDSCAASRPGFNSNKSKGQKVKSSGKMYK